jgi:HUS1 checkpoint protein
MFNTESFRVASRHFNLVAFAVDVGLLLKVLKSAVTNAPDTLDVKLTQCAVAVPGCEEVENKPFLCFTARVSSSAKGLGKQEQRKWLNTSLQDSTCLAGSEG